MVDVDKEFLKALGERIRFHRKRLGITQVEMAEQFGCSQPTITSYENGRLRLPVSFLPELATTFGISLDELLGVEEFKEKRKPGRASRLQERIDRLKELPRSRQEAALDMLDGLLGSRSA